MFSRELLKNRFMYGQFVCITKLSFIFYYNSFSGIFFSLRDTCSIVRMSDVVFDGAGVRDYQASGKVAPFTDPLKLPVLEIF